MTAWKPHRSLLENIKLGIAMPARKHIRANCACYVASDARPLARLANCRVGDVRRMPTVGPVLGVPPTGRVDLHGGRAGIGRSTVTDHGAVGLYHNLAWANSRLSNRVTILLRCETLWLRSVAMPAVAL